MAGKYKVQITGLRQVLNALEATDKAAADLIKKEISRAAKNVAGEAKKIVGGMGTPLSGWGAWRSSRDGRDLGFDAGDVIRGIKVQRNNYRKAGVARGIGWDVYNKNAGGAIFEVIGSGQRVGESPVYVWQGAGFVRRIARRYDGKQPRILLPAYYRGLPDNFRDELRDRIIQEARRAGLT